MKKQFLAVTAVVLAVSLSAFTSLPKPARQKGTTTETPYFWYTLDPATGKVSSTALNDVEDIKDNVIDGGVNQLTDCSDVISTVCLAGSTSAQLAPGDTPDMVTCSRDNRINHN